MYSVCTCTHGVQACGRCGIPDGVWGGHFQFCGDEERHAAVPMSVIELEAQLGVCDLIREVPQHGFVLPLDHLGVV